MTTAQILARGWEPSAINAPVPGLPGWTETDVEPRLVELRHESAPHLPVFYRRVGWQRPRPFVRMPDGSERRFGWLTDAVAFALEAAGRE